MALILGASNGIAFCTLACSSRSFSSTKRNFACGSTNRLINQGQATRSTLMSFLVIQFIFASIHRGLLGCNSMFETMKENTGCTGGKNQERFRNFLCAEQNQQSYTADQNSRQVNDGTTSEDKSSACDGAHGRCGNALHKSFHLAILSKSSVIRSAEEHYHVRRCKDGESG